MSESLTQDNVAEGADAPVDAPADTQTATSTSGDRPEWLPEKFKSPEDLAKSYSELSQKLGAKEDDIREKLKAEMEAPKEGVPDTSGDYQLPDFIDDETATDNEELRQWAEYSHEQGFTQDQFAKGLEMYAEAMNSGMPDLEAETKKLGDNANARIESASLFASKFFPEETMGAIERLCESADGIMALEHIMAQSQEPSVAEMGDRPTQITTDSLRTMMLDDRYHSPAHRDPAYIKMVEDGFKKLYG
tara:strand:+ start:498 stop:1238 length:741 start_codon:yes stop_codon:yes gene_type:complete